MFLFAAGCAAKTGATSGSVQLNPEQVTFQLCIDFEHMFVYTIRGISYSCGEAARQPRLNLAAERERGVDSSIWLLAAMRIVKETELCI